MAQINDQAGIPTVAPDTTAPDLIRRIPTSPQEFGASIGQGLQGLGAGASAAGKFYGEVAADHAYNNFQQQADKIVYGDPSRSRVDENGQPVLGPDGKPAADTGFLGLQGAAATKAAPQVSKQLDDLLAQTRATLSTGESQLQFDDNSRRYRSLLGTRIGEHTDQAYKAWYAETGANTYANGRALIEAHPDDPGMLHQGALLMQQAVATKLRLNGLDQDPDAVTAATREMAIDISSSRIKALTGRGDTNGALDVLTKDQAILSGSKEYDSLSQRVTNGVVSNFKALASVSTEAAYTKYLQERDQLPANARDQLEGYFLTKQNMDLNRQVLQAERADMNAQRHLRETQASTFGTTFADVLQGKPLDSNHIADLVRTQQLTPEQARTVLTGGGVRDDPATLLDLQGRARRGDDIMDDVNKAAESGMLKPTTIAGLVKTSVAAQQKDQDAVERASFSTLRTIAGGDAVEKGMLDLGDTAKAAQIQLWGAAQGEWNNRVLVKHEDPQAVLADMSPRYSHPIVNINALPQPRLGPINSLDDVSKIAAATNAAHDAGTMDDGTFQAEKELIVRRQGLLQQDQQRQDAARRAQQKPGSKPGVKTNE